MAAETEGLIRQMREALAARRAFDTEPECVINRRLYGEMDYAIAAADEWLAQATQESEVLAWAHPDGRVVPAETMKTALRDGGASASSLRGYTIALRKGN